MTKFVHIFFLLTSTGLFAQHISAYSQYMFNTLLLNPAYAGSQEALNLTALYRNQWVGIEGAPKTLTISAHTAFKNRKVNGGVIFSNDKIGICDHNRAAMIYTYRIKTGKGFFAFGLQGGMSSFRQNWQNIHTTQTNDVTFAIAPTRNILPEAGFGIYYHSKHFFLGTAAPYILIDDHISKYIPVNLHTGMVIDATDAFKIKPVVLVKYLKNSPLSIDLTGFFYWKDIIGLGLGYRMDDAAMVLADIKVNDQLRIGYCYDYTLSKLNNYSNGSHEFMIRYLFEYKLQQAKGMRYF